MSTSLLDWRRALRASARGPIQTTDQAELRKAAVAVVLRDRKATTLELLLMRRTEHLNDPWSGHISFPGGRVDPTDSDPLAAAHRETAEEVGIELREQGDLLGRLDPVRALARGRVLPLVIEPFVFELLEGEPTARARDEVAEVLWVPVQHLTDPERRDSFRFRREGLGIELPCVDWQGRRIWGLTLRMIDDLVARLARS